MIEEIVVLCIASFAVGFALCNFLYSAVFGFVRKTGDVEATSRDNESEDRDNQA